jgi:hypothetical protein
MGKSLTESLVKGDVNKNVLIPSLMGDIVGKIGEFSNGWSEFVSRASYPCLGYEVLVALFHYTGKMPVVRELKIASLQFTGGPPVPLEDRFAPKDGQVAHATF